ncbi:MAG: acyl-CoA dehydrogenase family protein [Alphaproteobacteria bacterium]|nr:acyl-CoA dehydrogenase family protein [Alphaproteobacteria bacterium]
MFELSDTQKALQQQARTLAQREFAPRAAEIDRSEAYPRDNIETLVKAGFMGFTLPREYGGQGLGYLEVLLIVEEIAKACGVTARIVVEGNMGAIGAIMEYGTDAQKRLAAELVLAGDKPAICITEPGAGSAASQMTTRAERRGDRYLINGSKHWITGGGVSKLHLIFARVFADGVEQGIAGFIVVRDADTGAPAGLRIGRREKAMGLRGIPETELFFEDLEVPDDMALIPPEGVRRGFAGLMNAYNAQRLGAGTVALGIAAGAYELALDYAGEREQFGRPIAEFQGLQWMLVDMHTRLEAARLLLHRAAAGAGTGFPDVVQAAEAKIFASESAIAVTNDALQIFGAAGYSRDLPLERMVRDARMFTIGGGTAQILRTVVASRLLNRKLPQTRDGYLNMPHGT